MRKSVFLTGFGISVLLVAVCLWYAFASPVRRDVLEAFDFANRGWYVHQPPVYNVCVLAFAVLNLPVILLSWGLQAAVDGIVALPALSRAMVTFASWILLSAGWWGLIARWCGRRSRVAGARQ